MQQLALVARLFPALLNGEKTATIRWREAHIEPGPMIYICEDDPTKSAVVQVTRCTYMPLAEVAAFLDKADAWPAPVMLEGMQEHYPEIALTDVVQVIEHRAPETPIAE